MPTEHKAVTDPFKALQKEGYEVTWLEPDSDGILSVDALRDALQPNTQLVSIMHVNNETGVMQDIEAIGRVCRDHGVLFHCDAAQSAGKLPLDLSQLPIDLLSVTAHKFYGPQGIGALYIAPGDGCDVKALTFGGGQERRLRPGTLPVPLIVGFGAAATLAAGRNDVGPCACVKSAGSAVGGLESPTKYSPQWQRGISLPRHPECQRGRR